MKVLIGLGNPEEKYKATRHNVGQMLCDYLSNNLKKKIFIVLKSDSHMNDSGSFVLKQKNKRNFESDSLYITHDDLDLKLGDFKIQFAKGPKDHNGLNDIYEKLSTNEFWHIRIGVDNRGADNRTEGREYVLSDFKDEEINTLNNVFKEICKKLEE